MSDILHDIRIIKAEGEMIGQTLYRVILYRLSPMKQCGLLPKLRQII